MRRAAVLALLVLSVGVIAVAAAGCGGEEEVSPTAETVEGGDTEATTGETTMEEDGGEGDAEAGKAIYAEAGCGGCHVLSDAGSSGTVGPNLDDSKPSFDLTVERVTNGSGAMPSFKDQLSEQQINDVATYVSETAAR